MPGVGNISSLLMILEKDEGFPLGKKGIQPIKGYP
jgi:hypothetical protein